ncbi:MAG: hypothetical protein EON54_24015 [Alcaligenaceae bacterium]|nr:MAG: hypothetical protein EON54_24015 [Alcaligenaceae bacterium]
MSAFSRKQQTNPSREIAAFLEEAYDTMSRAVVTTGLALNEWLGRSDPEGLLQARAQTPTHLPLQLQARSASD